MVTAEDFRRTTRHGRRTRARTLAVHCLWPAHADAAPTRFGFVVSRAVGDAVTRNRVKRRLRHLVRERLVACPDGGLVVVRAFGAAATAGYADLGRDLDRGLDQCLDLSLGQDRERVVP